MGWASGIGRIRRGVGPVLTGALLTLELPHQMNFLAIAMPGFIAALAIFLVICKLLWMGNAFAKALILMSVLTCLPSNKTVLK